MSVGLNLIKPDLRSSKFPGFNLKLAVLNLNKQRCSTYLLPADAVDRIVHDGNEGVEENNDGQEEVDGEKEHGSISRHGKFLVSAAKFFNCTWVKNIPKQKFEYSS